MAEANQTEKIARAKELAFRFASDNSRSKPRLYPILAMHGPEFSIIEE